MLCFVCFILLGSLQFCDCHVVLTFPPARLPYNFYSSVGTVGPCGVASSPSTSILTLLEKESAVNLTWSAPDTFVHSSSFRIDLLYGNITEGSTSFSSIPLNGNYFSNGLDSGKLRVSLPFNFTCSKCVIRLTEYAPDLGGNLWSCADVSIVYKNYTCVNGCSSHGSCGSNGTLCSCDPAFFGDYCSDGPRCGSNGDCSGQGSCYSESCYCNPGYYGTACDRSSASDFVSSFFDESAYLNHVVSFPSKSLTLYWKVLLSVQQIEFAIIFNGSSVSLGFGAPISSNSTALQDFIQVNPIIVANSSSLSTVYKMGAKDVAMLKLTGLSVMAVDGYSPGKSSPVSDILIAPSSAQNNINDAVGAELFSGNNSIIRFRRPLTAADSNLDFPVLDGRQTLFWCVGGNFLETDECGTLTANFYLGYRSQPRSIVVSLMGPNVTGIGNQLITALSTALAIPVGILRVASSLQSVASPPVTKVRVVVLPKTTLPLTPLPSDAVRQIMEETSDSASPLRNGVGIGRSIIGSEWDSCVPSWISGYDCVQEVPSSSSQFSLHWRVDLKGGYVNFLASANTLGYVAVGFSPNGRMIGSLAIIGMSSGQDSVSSQAFVTILPAKTDSAVFQSLESASDPLFQQNFVNVTVQSSAGVTRLQFSRPLLPATSVSSRRMLSASTSIINGALTNLLWAVSTQAQIGKHTEKGSFSWTTTGIIPASPCSDLVKGVISGSAMLHPLATLMWNATNDVVTFSLTVQSQGWVGLGFSPGMMLGSEAVIGWVSPTMQGEGVWPFTLQEKAPVGILRDSNPTISDASIVRSGGTTTITFTRRHDNGGKFQVCPLSSTRMIWAFGDKDSLVEHVHRGAFDWNAQYGISSVCSRARFWWLAPPYFTAFGIFVLSSCLVALPRRFFLRNWLLHKRVIPGASGLGATFVSSTLGEFLSLAAICGALAACIWIHHDSLRCENPNLDVNESVGRGFGSAATCVQVLMLMPVSKNSIWMRLIGKSALSMTKWHVWLSWLFFGIVIAHIVLILQNRAFSGQVFLDNSLLRPSESFPHGGSIWATVAVALMFIQYLLSLEFVRRRAYEVFLWSHAILTPGILIMTLMHHLNWVLLAPIGLHFLDTIFRFIRSRLGVKIVATESLHDGCTAVAVRASHLKHHQAGDYAYLQFPEISAMEWHPFIITSPPGSDIQTFHIRIRGNWTNMVSSLAMKRRLDRVLIDGPYGSSCESIQDYSCVVLIAGGIGITSMIPRLLWVGAATSVRRIVLVWTVTEPCHLDWFSEHIMKTKWVLAQHHRELELHLHATCMEPGSNGVDPSSIDDTRFSYSPNGSEDVEMRSVIAERTIAGARFKRGRPKLAVLLRVNASTFSDVGVWVSGPESLVCDVRSHCNDLGLAVHVDSYTV